MGHCRIENYMIPPTLAREIPIPVAFGTWTLPFDQCDGIVFIASAYAICGYVRSWWEAHVQGPVIWYCAHQARIGQTLDVLELEMPLNEVASPKVA